MISRMYSVANGDTGYEASQSPTLTTPFLSNSLLTSSIRTRPFYSSEQVKMDDDGQLPVLVADDPFPDDEQTEARSERSRASENDLIQIVQQIDSRMGKVETNVAQLTTSNAQLTTIVGNLTTNVDKRFETLQKEIAKSNGAFAREASDRFTIKLLLKDGSCFGHGALMKDREDSHAIVITASHICIDAKQYQKCGSFTKISFVANDMEFRVSDEETFPLKIFIEDCYVRNGNRDCGGFRFKFNGNSPDIVDNLVVSQAHAFDTEFHGRSDDVKFRSNAVSVLEGDRVRLSAHSKFGCSGTPMFSSTGELLSVLHGETKHRARRHSGTLSPNDMSSLVYVDMVKDMGELKLWEHKFFSCIRKMEFLSEEELENPTKKLYKPQGNVQDEEVDAFQVLMQSAGKVRKYASDEAMDFFEAAEDLCHMVYPAVFEGTSFTIEAVCDAVLNCHQETASARSLLEHFLVKDEEGDFVYKAYAAYESGN